MNAQQIMDLEKQYVVHTYNRPSFVFERGEGLWVYDTEGKAYLDFLGGIAVNGLGHCHPAVVKAIQEQQLIIEKQQVQIDLLMSKLKD